MNKAGSGRYSPGPGFVVIIRKHLDGPGYFIDPILGWNESFFGGTLVAYRNMVSAKNEVDKAYRSVSPRRP